MQKTVNRFGFLAMLVLFVCFGFSPATFAAVPESESPEQLCRQCGINPEIDYMVVMQELCLNGNIEGGEEIERLRNLKIDILGLEEQKVSYMDLFLLSKIITLEAGSYWLPMDWKLSVGEVLLNRVNSPEYPNTIPDCIYSPGQYYSEEDKTFQSTLPYFDCVIAAKQLLSGDRILNDSSVVFQANFPQGEIFQVLHDDLLGDTYLCKSSHTNLYQ